MRTIVVQRLGGPDVLAVEDRPTPEPGEGQLLVDVAAAGVNFMDIYQREGKGYALDPPFPLGQEGAGTVTAVGPGVTTVAVGERVAWASAQGSYAEQALVPADRAIAVPAGVDLQVAAAALLQGMTAHYLAASTYPVGAGDVAVVHAAAGGVGLLLTQLVKSRGGVVVATTSDAEKGELARQAGRTASSGTTTWPRPWRTSPPGSAPRLCTTESAKPRSTPAWRRCARAE